MRPHPRRRRDMLKRIEKFTCPFCSAVVGCDELGKLGMYSLKIFNRHVQRCQEITEALRAGDAQEAQRLRDDLP